MFISALIRRICYNPFLVKCFFSFIIDATWHQSLKSSALTPRTGYFLKNGIIFSLMSLNLVTLKLKASIQFIIYPESNNLMKLCINCRVRLSGLLQLASLWTVRDSFPSYGSPNNTRPPNRYSGLTFITHFCVFPDGRPLGCVLSQGTLMMVRQLLLWWQQNPVTGQVCLGLGPPPIHPPNGNENPSYYGLPEDPGWIPHFITCRIEIIPPFELRN